MTETLNIVKNSNTSKQGTSKMRNKSQKSKGIFGLIAQKCPKYTVYAPLSKGPISRALCDMPGESYIILNTGLPCIIVCIAISAYQFFALYKIDPWGAIYTYRSFAEIIVTSFAITLCAPLLLDIMARRNGKN